MVVTNEQVGAGRSFKMTVVGKDINKQKYYVVFLLQECVMSDPALSLYNNLPLKICSPSDIQLFSKALKSPDTIYKIYETS
jgi:hypothetical protein